LKRRWTVGQLGSTEIEFNPFIEEKVNEANGHVSLKPDITERTLQVGGDIFRVQRLVVAEHKGEVVGFLLPFLGKNGPIFPEAWCVGFQHNDLGIGPFSKGGAQMSSTVA
jgi:hypothetical protein